MHCMHYSMSKGIYRAEATSNSEKMKPIALAIIELQASVRQSVENSTA